MKYTLSYLITHFFRSYLTHERGVSKNTIEPYSDTLRILITHQCKKRNKHPEELEIQQIDTEAILDFLDYLERDRANGASTRNQRLAAIKSFYHYAARENSELMLSNEQIQAIRSKKPTTSPRRVSPSNKSTRSLIPSTPPLSSKLGTTSPSSKNGLGTPALKQPVNTSKSALPASEMPWKSCQPLGAVIPSKCPNGKNLISSTF